MAACCCVPPPCEQARCDMINPMIAVHRQQTIPDERSVDAVLWSSVRNHIAGRHVGWQQQLREVLLHEP